MGKNCELGSFKSTTFSKTAILRVQIVHSLAETVPSSFEQTRQVYR